MKANIDRFVANGILGITLLGVIGCVGPQPPAAPVLKTVGPNVIEVKPRPSGYLIVNSAPEQPNAQIYFDTRFYPHTGYSIYDSNGVLVREVRNHLGAWDETLEKVSLPPGKYTVVALSEVDGRVAVPVVIQRAKTTFVDLKRPQHTIASL